MAYWSIREGPCSIDREKCLTSPNFPQSYGGEEYCEVDVFEEDWVNFEIKADASFYTEGCCDHLTINGEDFSHNKAPNGVVPSGQIFWHSDELHRQQTGFQGWRICPVETAGAVEAASGGVALVPVIVGAVVGALLLAGAILFFFCRKSSKGTSATTTTAVRPVVSATKDAEMGERERPFIPVRPTGAAPSAETVLPRYWRVSPDAKGAELVDISTQGKELFQALLDRTFKSISTRDRKSELPTKLELVSVKRVENPLLWKKYATGRYAVRSKRDHKCTPVSELGGEMKTVEPLPSDWKGNLDKRVNEVYMWHGTTPNGASGICNDGFNLRLSGTKTGSMFGGGVYFAECSSKSDEYAMDEGGMYSGLYCLLLCRVTLGELLHLTVGGEATHTMIKSGMESGAYDSVLGDRKASVGTYREFVVYQEDQVYPEYQVMYRRVM